MNLNVSWSFCCFIGVNPSLCTVIYVDTGPGAKAKSSQSSSQNSTVSVLCQMCIYLGIKCLLFVWYNATFLTLGGAHRQPAVVSWPFQLTTPQRGLSLSKSQPVQNSSFNASLLETVTAGGIMSVGCASIHLSWKMETNGPPGSEDGLI